MAVSYVAAGTSSAISNASVTPGLPAGLADGDLMFAFWGVRSATATTGTPAGWSAPTYFRNTNLPSFAILTKTYVSGDAAPTLTIVGGGTNITAIGIIFAFRDTSGVGSTGTTFVSGVTQQDIGAITGVTTVADGAVVVLGCKGDDWSTATHLSGDGLTWATIADVPSTAGSDAGIIADYALTPSGTTVTSKTFLILGGGVAHSVGVMLALAPIAAAAFLPAEPIVINQAALVRAHYW